ncbi:hypothetical protein O9992_24000 [Vibrio lentus]|nr:hypothetical protein [Vibrio lentus]
MQLKSLSIHMIKDGDIWVSASACRVVQCCAVFVLPTGFFHLYNFGFSIIEQFGYSGVVLKFEPCWEAWLIRRY